MDKMYKCIVFVIFIINAVQSFNVEILKTSYIEDEFCDIGLDYSNGTLQILSKNFIKSSSVINLDFKNNSINTIQKGAFDSLPNLRSLDLSNNNLDLKNLFSFGSHANLETLILNNNIQNNYNNGDTYHIYNVRTFYYETQSSKIGQFYISNSYTFPKLLTLSMRNVGMEYINVDWQLCTPNLTSLDLSENPMSHVDINNDILKKLPSTVTDLFLESMQLVNLCFTSLSENITSLFLNGNDFKKIIGYSSDMKYLSLRYLKNLQKLSCSDCNIELIGKDAFMNARNLLYLDLSMNNIKSIQDDAFDPLVNLINLDISENPLSALSFICSMKNLETLQMNNLNSTVEIEVCQIPKLRQLSVSGNNLRNIDGLINNKTLEELDLSYNNFNELAYRPALSSIRILNLKGNDIKNLDKISLEGAMNLQLLIIEENPVKMFSSKFTKTLPNSTTVLL